MGHCALLLPPCKARDEKASAARSGSSACILCVRPSDGLLAADSLSFPTGAMEGARWLTPLPLPLLLARPASFGLPTPDGSGAKTGVGSPARKSRLAALCASIPRSKYVRAGVTACDSILHGYADDIFIEEVKLCLQAHNAEYPQMSSFRHDGSCQV